MVTLFISRFRCLPVTAVFLIMALCLCAAAYATVDHRSVRLRAQVPRMASPSAAHRSTRLQGKAEVLEDWQYLKREADRLRALHPQMGVDAAVPLKGKVAELADGTKLASLKDDQLFDSASAHLVRETATVDMNEGFIKKSVYKAFVRMDCLEFMDLGSNYYTAPEAYRSLMCGGRNIVIGASDGTGSPVLHITIAGRVEQIAMDLPGLNKNSHNVMVVTDGTHVLSIDPRTADTWKLESPGGDSPLKWCRLTHNKGKLL